MWPARSEVRGRLIRGVLCAAALALVWAPASQAATLGAVTMFTAGLRPNSHPTGLVVGPDGDLWFTDAPNTPAIGRITPAGEIREFTGPMTDESFPRDMAAGDGYLWFTDRGSIGRASTDGTISEFRAIPDSLSGEGRLALAADGNVWFTETGTVPTLGRITPNGEVMLFSSSLPAGSRPEGIIAGPDGNLWFTDDGATPGIGKVTPSGEVTEFPTGAGQNGEPYSLIAGPDGNLWFTEDDEQLHENSAKAIDRITPTGAITRFTDGLGANCPISICAVSGLTSGSDRDVWFLDQDGPFAGRIGTITPSGAITLYTAGPAPIEQQSYLTPGPEGALWFANDGASTAPGESTPTAIGRITTTGAVNEFSAGLPAGPYPEGLTVGPEAGIWFVDGNAIGRLSTTGELPVPVASVPSVSAPRPTGSLTIRRARLSVDRSGHVSIPVSCAGTADCAGTLTLTSRSRSRGARRDTGPKRFGAVSLSVEPGATGTRRLDLNRTGRRALGAHHGELAAMLTITKRRPAPQATQRTPVVLLRVANRTKARARTR
jgi:streptogramin lyase